VEKIRESTKGMKTKILKKKTGDGAEPKYPSIGGRIIFFLNSPVQDGAGEQGEWGQGESHGEGLRGRKGITFPGTRNDWT